VAAGNLRAAPGSESVIIRRAHLSDAGVLAELAARTFRDTFAADNRSEDLELHLARSFGLIQQSAELADPSITTLIADIAGEATGYAQLKRGTAPDCVPGPSPMEVMRFYLDHAWHGRGIAQQLMEATVQEAVRQGARTLWLGVWERNARAQAFYRKCNFTHVGTKIFYVGEDPQSDSVMVRSL
jgi:ribosomal protein S18 acetylase RimI-like enzyme